MCYLMHQRIHFGVDAVLGRYYNLPTLAVSIQAIDTQLFEVQLDAFRFTEAHQAVQKLLLVIAFQPNLQIRQFLAFSLAKVKDIDRREVDNHFFLFVIVLLNPGNRSKNLDGFTAFLDPAAKTTPGLEACYSGSRWQGKMD